MTHHTRFVQRRLSVEDQHISIPQMSVDFFVDRGGSCVESATRSAWNTAILWGQQLIRYRRALLYSKLVLEAVINQDENTLEETAERTHKRLLMAIFVFYHRRPGVTFRSGNNPLS